MFITLAQQKITVPAQRSEQWFFQRARITQLKGLTGSKLANLLFEPDLNTARKKAYNYEKYPFTEEQKSFMEWGQKHEDTACQLFLKHNPQYTILESPMLQHDVPWAASSPDGSYVEFEKDNKTVKSIGCVEIKCPAKKKNVTPRPIYYYVAQCYWEMASSSTAFKNCLFIVWAPGADGSTTKGRLKAFKIFWDDRVWGAICNMVLFFRNFQGAKSTYVPCTPEEQNKYLQLQEELRAECHRATRLVSEGGTTELVCHVK